MLRRAYRYYEKFRNNVAIQKPLDLRINVAKLANTLQTDQIKNDDFELTKDSVRNIFMNHLSLTFWNFLSMFEHEIISNIESSILFLKVLSHLLTKHNMILLDFMNTSIKHGISTILFRLYAAKIRLRQNTKLSQTQNEVRANHCLANHCLYNNQLCTYVSTSETI